MEISIRPVRESDAIDIVGIYNPYVLGTCITFETEPVRTPEMAQRIADTLESSLPWLVAEGSGQIVGYSYPQNGKAVVPIATQSSPRCTWTQHYWQRAWSPALCRAY